MTEFNKNLEQDIALDWDSEISAESDFSPIKDGKYAFEVVGFERGYYDPQPGSKMIACHTADLRLRLVGEQGPVGELRQRLFMTKKMEWRLSAFFVSIGQKKKGEPFAPNWQKIIGSQGMCEVVRRMNKDGSTSDYSEVKRFLPPASELEGEF